MLVFELIKHTLISIHKKIMLAYTCGQNMIYHFARVSGDTLFFNSHVYCLDINMYNNMILQHKR